jgi:putative tryptophan/tyrosine transport system substrate-binding protein
VVRVCGPAVKRREFIAGLGGAAAWPLAAQGQERAVPVIGWLSSRTREFDKPFLVPFLRGLSERGYTEGRNIAIEYRWTETHDRMPALAAELVQRRVDVIFAVGTADTAHAAKAATAKIPIVFLLGVDPVQFGLVASLNRPGDNLTGYTSLTAEVVAKRLDLMLQLAPTAT